MVGWTNESLGTCPHMHHAAGLAPVGPASLLLSPRHLSPIFPLSTLITSPRPHRCLRHTDRSPSVRFTQHCFPGFCGALFGETFTRASLVQYLPLRAVACLELTKQSPPACKARGLSLDQQYALACPPRSTPPAGRSFPDHRPHVFPPLTAPSSLSPSISLIQDKEPISGTMAEVSSTRLYLGNLPRNGELSTMLNARSSVPLMEGSKRGCADGRALANANTRTSYQGRC